MSATPATAHTDPTAQGAVLSMAVCMAVLIATEFLPVSLLTPVAQDPGVTGGHAGQPVTAEAPGDLYYFRGWGNPAFVHSDDLILLDRIGGPMDPLLVRCNHVLQLYALN